MTCPAVAILPSLDEPATIAAVTTAVDTALADSDALVVLADASPGPDTAAAFTAVATRARTLSLTGLPTGKGTQILRAVRRIAADGALGPATKVLLADTDTRNPAPATYSALLSALGDGVAIALADYERFWDEANLTNHLARPLIAAATGYDVPHPLAGDVALTTAAIHHAVDLHTRLAPELAASVDGYGIDTFLLQAATTTGAASAVPLAMTKLHAPSFPHLPAIFAAAVPVLLAPARGLIESAGRGLIGNYRLTHRDLPEEHLDRMLTALRELRPPTGRYNGMSWPHAVAAAWNAVADGTAPDTAAGWLWPAYLDHVQAWLTTDARTPLDQRADALRITAGTVLDLLTGKDPRDDDQQVHGVRFGAVPDDRAR
jgi:hypothetical protein